MSAPASGQPTLPDSSTPASLPPLDVGSSPVRYVNFCRVTGTPEEVILDMGLQTPDDARRHAWEAPQRVALDFYTAKRLVFALHATLTQFEATFGKVEVDVEKRLLPRS